MVRKRGLKWQADAYVGQQRLRPSFNTKEEAIEFEIKAQSMVSTDNVGTILPEYAVELWETKKSWKDAHRITNEWVRRIGPDVPLHKVTDEVILRIVRDLRAEGNARQTINNKLTRLSKILRRAHIKRVIPTMPFIELKQGYSGRIRFLTPEEEQALFSHLSREDRAFCKFLLYTGCRVGEALALEWRDVTDTTVTFWVTKGDEARTIKLTAQAKEGLAEFKGSVRPFATIIYRTFLDHWHTAAEKAGLGDDEQVIPHVLRHTCASRLVQRGIDIRRVKEWMGHAHITTTMRYAHLAPKDLDEAAHVLEQGVNLVTKL